MRDLLNHPGDGFDQGLTEHSPTGLADSHQTQVNLFLRTVVLQLKPQGTVCQEHEIHVSGLALATPELRCAHDQMLLAVPMEGLNSCPALALDLEDAMHFPIRMIDDQYLARFGIALLFLQHHDPHGVLLAAFVAKPLSVHNAR
jgi:hypothetical protein